ncbi:MAG: hypothetical protein ABR577_16490 [Pyrinomonadaceae bacterium]
MYKPNFCAECGAQIVRAKWRVWTSRRFCPVCAPRFRKHRILLPVIVAAFVFSAGLVAGRLARTSSASSPPPLIIEQRPRANTNNATTATATTPKEVAAPGATTPIVSTNAPPTAKAETPYGKDGTFVERPTDPTEVVSICGARTQKGTPCSRRVRGIGRCWQHKGLPAMLPASKLIVEG